MLTISRLCSLAAVLLVVLFASPARSDGKMELRISIFPGGSFIARSSKVKGHAIKSGEAVAAKNIKVPTSSFDSGISLRDRHMAERFETGKYPEAVLLEARGQDGKGKGKLRVKGITKEIEGTYKVIDDKILEATFKAKASDFNIKDVSYMKVGMEDELEVFVRVPLKAGGRVPAENRAEKRKATKKK